MVHIFDTDSGRELGPLHHADPIKWISGLAWHPNGRLLASGCDDRKIHVWDVGRCAELMAPWVGHPGLGILLPYNHAGDRLVSADWTGQTRLWDAGTGRMILGYGAVAFQQTQDDRLYSASSMSTAARSWRR
jgi:WD40 repeat protein